MSEKCSRNFTTRSVVGLEVRLCTAAIAAIVSAYAAIQPVASACSSM
jgi:hypothetical protein